MKTFTNIGYKLGLIIISVFVLQFVNNIRAQDNPFVILKESSFRYNCETFYPLVINYSIQRIKVYQSGNNIEYHVMPTRGFCYKVNCGTNDIQRTCGENATEWKNEMKEQFIKIAELNFNTIRILDLMALKYNPDLYEETSNPYLQSSPYLEQRANPNSECFDKIEGLHVHDLEEDFEEFGNLLQEVIDVINESGKDLKLIVLMGGHGVEMLPDGYEHYLSYIANRFKDEPRIFAYDLYNEPNWFKYPQIPQPNKYEIAEMCMNWYNAIRNNAPSQFVTMGLEIYDVCQWDPEIIPQDFISFHHYQRLIEDYEQYSIIPPLKRFKVWFKWLSNTISKPYIIGETGLAGINEINISPPIVPWPEYWPSQQEQADYLSFTLQYSNLYNTIGYSWYDYKDKYTWSFLDDKIGDNFLGVVYNEDETGDTETSKIEDEHVLMNFDPDDECFDVLVGSDCTEPGEEYYHPNPENYNNYTLLTGFIKDGNGIEDAYIEASIYDISKDAWKVSHAITYNSGFFEIRYNMPTNVAYVDKITVSYPGRETITYHKDEIPGSGIIDLPLLNPSQLPIMPTYEYYTVPSNSIETWNTQRYIPYKEITIKDGAVLTITSDVFLDENAKIIVERKGKLIVDGGRITCSCGMWKGIEVWGTSTQPQNPSYQGWARVINGGTIENASMGIYTNKPMPDDGNEWDPGYTGGIVQGNDAHFINNKVAVQFFGYSYLSWSGFTDCEFVTNDDYPGSQPPNYFAEVSVMNWVNFKNCEFRNETQIPYYQSGIYSINSYITVEGKCLSSQQPCGSWDNGLFKNLYYGIYAIATNPNRFADIRHTDFDLNFRGLYISGMSKARVTSNRFIINTPFETGGGYGMYLNTSTGYWVEDNDFLHEVSSNIGVGLIVHNSGTNVNEIYNNRFNNLKLGISAQEQNGSIYGPPIGLQILCNNFDICSADVLIPKPRQKGWGIAPSQGSNSSNSTDMAGNLFYWESLTPDNDYDDINNQGRFVTYYYPSNPDPAYPNVRPIDYTHAPPYNTVLIVPKNVIPPIPDLYWTPENGCPPGIEGGGGGGRSSGELRALIEESELKIDSTDSLLSMLVDGGYTDDLQEDVEYSLPPEAMAIYSELIDNSPYLSDTVVSTAIEKEEVLPGAMIRDVMVANPHTAKSDEMMNKLDERWTPLPEYMKEQILQGKNIVSVKEKTESKLGRLKLDKAKAMNELERIYRNDSIAGTDSLAALYTTDGDLQSKYKLAFLSMEQGAWSMGMATLDNIHEEFELNAEENAEYEQMAEYAGVITSLQGAQPDSTVMTELIGIMESEKGAASMYALNTLFDLGAIDYDEPIEMPEMLKSAEVSGSVTNTKNNNTDKSRLLKVMPNPAKNYILVEYELEVKGSYEIEITDLTGKPVHSLQAANLRDQVMIDTRNWKPGTYIASLKISGRIKEIVKFTITD